MTRMPSAPTPVWRSQSRRATSAHFSGNGLRSSTTRKSLPSPCTLMKRIDDLDDMLLDGAGSALEPPDPGMAPEPGSLRPRVAAGALDQRGLGLVQGQRARPHRARLAVADAGSPEGGVGHPARPRR